jgi:hypothetical protein
MILTVVGAPLTTVGLTIISYWVTTSGTVTVVAALPVIVLVVVSVAVTVCRPAVAKVTSTVATPLTNVTVGGVPLVTVDQEEEENVAPASLLVRSAVPV